MSQLAGTIPGTLQTKARMTGAGGAPTSLAAGEMAWNHTDGVMYFGDGDNGSGIATSIIKLAGSGAFLLASLLGAASGVAPLDVNSKVPVANLPASVVGAMNYQGTYNPATNTPQLLSGQGTKGYYYKLSAAGISTNTTVGTAQGAAGTTVNVASATNIAVGNLVTGSGVAAGTTVASISGSNITLSATTTTALASGTALTFASYLDGTTGTNFQTNDLVAFDGTTWDKIDGPTEAVTSVAGRTGVVVISSTDITDSSVIGRSLLTATSLAIQRAALKIDSVTTVADAAYQLLATDFQVEYTSITAARVATLPAAASVNAGARVRVGDRSGSVTSSITIAVTPAGSDKINGAATAYSIAAAYGQVELISDGTANWTLVNATAPQTTGVYGGSF